MEHFMRLLVKPEAPDFDTMSDSLKAEMINGIGLNNDAMVADGSAVGIGNATDRALLISLLVVLNLISIRIQLLRSNNSTQQQNSQV